MSRPEHIALEAIAHFPITDPNNMDAANMAQMARRALVSLREPMTIERIDYIAELVVKSMPDGIQGFAKSWGWQQFARRLLEVCPDATGSQS